MKYTKKISVVIPTYNEEKNIGKCLKVITRQTIPRKEYEIIIVDWGSTDRTKKIAKQYVDRFILQKSEGIGGARNDGVRIAKADIIATTDADCLVSGDWLEKMLNHFEDKRYVAVCGSDGPVEKDPKARAIYFFLKNIIHFASFFHLYCLGGGNTAFRKRQFLRVGGYRNLSFSDDADLGFRLAKIGRIKYDRSIYVKLSTRRMEKQGYRKILMTWLNGDLRLILGLPIPKKSYARLKYQ